MQPRLLAMQHPPHPVIQITNNGLLIHVYADNMEVCPPLTDEHIERTYLIRSTTRNYARSRDGTHYRKCRGIRSTWTNTNPISLNCCQCIVQRLEHAREGIKFVSQKKPTKTTTKQASQCIANFAVIKLFQHSPHQVHSSHIKIDMTLIYRFHLIEGNVTVILYKIYKLRCIILSSWNCHIASPCIIIKYFNMYSKYCWIPVLVCLPVWLR